MPRFTTVAFVISAIAVAGVGLANPPTTRAAGATVSIGDGSFGPTALTIAVGDTVTWTNDDDSPHTVTAGTFDSGNIDPGATFAFTFTEPGTYGYVCQYHDEMQATIIVTPPADDASADVTAVNEADDGVAPNTDQPNTAAPAPGAPTTWVPGLLIGLGLVAFAVAVVPPGSMSARRAAQPARRSAGWRR